MFVNGSTGQPNDEAILESEAFVIKEEMCLTFHYHMKGADVDTLEVDLREVKWF